MPNQPVFGTLYTLDRFVYRQNSTLLYCTIKEIIILKIACFGVIYVPFSRVITRYNVYFFTRECTAIPPSCTVFMMVVVCAVRLCAACMCMTGCVYCLHVCVCVCIGVIGRAIIWCKLLL